MGAISESQDIIQFETPYQAKGNKAPHSDESQFWSNDPNAPFWSYNPRAPFWGEQWIEDEHFCLYLDGDANSHPSYFDQTSNGEEGTPVAKVYATAPKELTWRGKQRLLQDFIESLPVSAARGSLVRTSNRVQLLVSLDGKSIPELKKDFVKRWETLCEVALEDIRNRQNSRWPRLKPDSWSTWAKIPYRK